MDWARVEHQDGRAFKQRAEDWFYSEPAGLLRRTYRRRQYIYREGDGARHLGMLQSGSAEILTAAHRKSCPTELRFAGDLIGELVLCGQPLRLESVITLEPVIVRLAPVEQFMAFVTEAGLTAQLAAYFASALQAQQRRFANMLIEKCERRLALTLLDLAERHGGEGAVPLHLTQAELGKMVGTTRSRIGYFLKHFRELGLLGHIDGAGLEVDRARLAEFCR